MGRGDWREWFRPIAERGIQEGKTDEQIMDRILAPNREMVREFIGEVRAELARKEERCASVFAAIQNA